MKTRKIYIYLIIMLFLTIGMIFNSCKKDELPNGGKPVIYYVRVTDPASSDSLLTSAFLGDLVAIVGDNLENTRELWFNDQEASIRPTYVTNDVILVTVPNTLPIERNDKMKLVFSDGSILEYSFYIDIPSPRLDSILCEHASIGGTVVLVGQYFYDPTVIFPGDVEGEVVDFTDTKIKVLVPEGAGIGNIQVVNAAGKSTSTFIFGDTTGMLMDFDAIPVCYGGMDIASADSNPDPESISGNFAQIVSNSVAGSTWWNESFVFASCKDFGLSPGTPSDYIIKFDINVAQPWSLGWVEIKIINDEGEFFYRFRPYLNTTDATFVSEAWYTMWVPLDQFRIKSTSGNPDGAYITDLISLREFYFAYQNNSSSATGKMSLSFDNIRVVSKN